MQGGNGCSKVTLWFLGWFVTLPGAENIEISSSCVAAAFTASDLGSILSFTRVFQVKIAEAAAIACSKPRTFVTQTFTQVIGDAL